LPHASVSISGIVLIARTLGIEGDVKLRVSLDASGSVTSVKVISGLGHGLDAEAVEAIKHRCKFTAAIATDGHAVPFVITPYVFHFEIPR
jgi:TonB family protein